MRLNNFVMATRGSPNRDAMSKISPEKEMPRVCHAFTLVASEVFPCTKLKSANLASSG